MVVEKSFWDNRRVLVTGHTGFKGTWLVTWLHALGARVTGFALAPRVHPSLFESLAIGGEMRNIDGDVTRPHEIMEAVRVSRPEIVIHLAGQAIVREALADPLSTMATNVMGTANLLEAVRAMPDVRAIVCVTSDKCYEPRTSPCIESDPLGGHEPYAASKACAELLVRAWKEAFFRIGDAPAIATARAGNVIGAGDFSAHRIVPDIVRAVQARQPVRLRSPAAIRPWQHVLDALNGYLRLAQALVERPDDLADAYNFGPVGERDWSVGELAGMMVRSMGSGRILTEERDDGIETPVLRLDPTAATRDLAWRPLLATEEAITWTARGYRDWLSEGSLDWLDDQIRSYTERMHDGEGVAASRPTTADLDVCPAGRAADRPVLQEPAIAVPG